MATATVVHLETQVEAIRPQSLEQNMFRLTRYITLLAISVGITLAAALPANALRLPPPDQDSVVHDSVVVRNGLSIGQAVLIAACSSLLTVALFLATRWARAHQHGGGLAHA